jgi:serine/threonine protein phosphatase PrpC
MRSAQLHGRNTEEIGTIDAVAEGPAAIALSRGGSAKRYEHVDPNEDSCAFAIGDGGVLIAVADGHHGEFGARLAIEYVSQTLAPVVCSREAPASDGAGWADCLYGALREISRQILDYASARQVPPAPTTLALAVVRQHEGYWAWAGAGDSHAFRVREDEAEDVVMRSARKYFLGSREESWHRKATALGAEPLAATRSIVLATDGLSEAGIGVEDPAALVQRTVKAAQGIEPGRRTQWLAREIAEQANASHHRQRSGDNIAAAAIGP